MVRFNDNGESERPVRDFIESRISSYFDEHNRYQAKCWWHDLNDMDWEPFIPNGATLIDADELIDRVMYEYFDGDKELKEYVSGELLAQFLALKFPRMSVSRQVKTTYYINNNNLVSK